ncbi:tRNA dimethylallyltransferase-like [Mytilus californianus]|uniref:tRNA dimethylallyltransferase-like n=1 Tax=Mytilus californianus TaxID=6549 RepID=UPI0022450143|nr:tRNA dimethylallyltransferase-like [Mytilus californianus]
MSASMRLPLVVILGATGSGKSKLALEIGRLFNAEIISADSMQIYKGLDIITNKVTNEELKQCPHHMIDYLDPLKENHTVVDFRDTAVPIIDKIFKSNKIPIIVGGTNYYIEALMWKFLIDKQDIEKASAKLPKLSTVDVTSETATQCRESENPEVKKEIIEQDECNRNCDVESVDNSFKQSYEEEDTLVLHQKLMEIDEKQGRRIHPRNKRKIIRALEVYQNHGVEMSKILESQKSEIGEESLRGQLRYDNTCIFWIQADKQVLDSRTDKRVDEMIDKGLLTELQDFHKQYNSSRIKDNNEVDYTHGIFQSIGFKEFHDYLLLPDVKRDTEKGKQLLQKGIEEMKLVTRRYARTQVRWVKNRFLRYRGSCLPPVYGLDSTDVSQWEDNVNKPAINILNSVLKGEKTEYEPIPAEQSYNVPVYNICDVCDMVFTMNQEWEAHLKGKKHNGMLRAKRKREEREEYKRQVEKKEKHEKDTSLQKELAVTSAILDCYANKASSSNTHEDIVRQDTSTTSDKHNVICDQNNESDCKPDEKDEMPVMYTAEES